MTIQITSSIWEVLEWTTSLIPTINILQLSVRSLDDLSFAVGLHIECGSLVV